MRGFRLECVSATQHLIVLLGAVIALCEGVKTCSLSHHTQQLIGVPGVDSVKVKGSCMRLYHQTQHQVVLHLLSTHHGARSTGSI